MAVIRVSGYPGSGKTTLCKKLSEALGYGYFYTGGIFREMAKEAGLTIEEFYARIAADPTLEKGVDDRQIELMNREDNIVVEGRMAPFFPSAFKMINVLLTVSSEEGARRELNRIENKERTLEEMMQFTRERVETERRHYRTLYGIENHLGDENYSIVIDTTELTPEVVFEKIKDEIEARIK